MTHKERWVKSGLFGSGMNAHFTIEAQTDHSTGPTFAQIDVAHSTPEALATADERATLIAAAPELLEALKYIIETDKDKFMKHAFKDICKRAKAAIAKAEVTL